MKTVSILTVFGVLGTNITNVSAGCYTGGDTWANKGDAVYHAGRACRGYDGNQGVFQGSFAPGEVKNLCYQYGDQKWEFQIFNLNTGAGFDLNDDDCANGLSKEIIGCDSGGQSDNSGWRFSETGEHVENSNHEIEWIPFPICEETNKPLEFQYGHEGELNCTIPMITDPFFHLLEFYIHNDAPLSCRLPARPKPHVETVGEKPHVQEYIPLVFALAGTLQLSHLHVSTHMNVLLHSMPKHHTRPHDSGVLDSGTAYSTSPLSHMDGTHTKRLVIGDPLPLTLSVRWFPTPNLPKIEGHVEWQGMGGHVYASTVFYIITSFMAGVLVAGTYFFGVVLPKRLRGRGLGGATPLGYGLNGVGNGWGYSKAAKRMD
ncbi:hypothetical protein K4K59_003233 [Colletotrichum sp. SAR11_240]|nr:hypothetical protein K4K59_003233 [Colletotrichum sp. SAR11_240]